MYKKYGAVVVVILCVALLFYRYQHQKSSLFKSIHVGNQDLSVEVADTESLRELGLGNRDTLGRADGMLFVLDTQGIYGFWMKDMRFDLDIVWIDTDRKVIGIEKSVSKDSYPKVFYPPQDVMYTLEMKAGSADQFGIQKGDKLLYY